MNVALHAFAPRVLMPPPMMRTIVVTFLVTLFVPGIGLVMHYLTILYDTTG